MENYTIFVVLGILFVIYLFITIYNRKRSKKRKYKKFMDGHTRKERERKD